MAKKRKRRRWDQKEINTLIKSQSENWSWDRIRHALPTRSEDAIKSRIRVLKPEHIDGAEEKTGEGYELKGNGANTQILILNSKTIRDPYKALAEANIDLKIWEINNFVVNKWDMAAKRADNNSLMVTELWQVKVWLTRKDKNPLQTGLERFIEKVKAPKYPKLNRKITGEHMLEISLFDAHFGKLAWAPETGDNYDLNIAKTLYKNAVEDLLAKTMGFGVEKILFPVGSDFFHINDQTNTTKSGNILDVDGRLPKIFDAGCESVIGAIEMCLNVAPVEVLWVPGNHDRQTSMYLCKFLDAWFRNHKEVTIDVSPKFRKYKQYGVNFIGFTHGDCEKHATLPAIMAGEVPDLWAKTRFREWHLGHFHKKKETSFSVGDSYIGVMVKVLPSLCGTDAWHYEMGYVKGIRSAEAYLWHKDDGYAGHLSSHAPGT